MNQPVSFPEFFRHTLEETNRQLSHSVSTFLYDYFELNCGELPDPVWQKGKDEPETLKKLISWAARPVKTRPCVYRIVWRGDLSPDSVFSSFKAYLKDDTKKRATPGVKKKPYAYEQTLYVGKVEKDMCGRIMTHLGYYYNTGTAGLQLVEWARQINLHVAFHIWSFEPGMKDYVALYERALAKAYPPLIGKKH
ncbi:MAG: hypothetical protein IM638_10780 [Bacteroidetes bacterium]|nr:hypothetical protein [Bacteroidota bacterium]